MDKKVIGHNFGLGPERFNLEEEKMMDYFDLKDDQLDLDPQLPEKRVKGYIDMSKGEERFKEKLNEDPFYEDQPLNELDNDVHEALKAVRPKIPVPDFNRYTAGEKIKDIKAVKEDIEKKEKKVTENAQKSKTTYQVKNNFKGAAKGKKGKVKMNTRKKPKEFASAEDEVN